MPCRCSVYGCKSNYDSQHERVTTFSLPKQEPLRTLWLSRIRTDFSNVKHPYICIKHFDEASIMRYDACTVRGVIKIYPRVIPKLIENAVPSIFPAIPEYLPKIQNSFCVADIKRENYINPESVEKEIEVSLNGLEGCFKNKICNLRDSSCNGDTKQQNCIEQENVEKEIEEGLNDLQSCFKNKINNLCDSFSHGDIKHQNCIEKEKRESLNGLEDCFENDKISNLCDIALFFEKTYGINDKWALLKSDKKIVLCFFNTTEEVPELLSNITVDENLNCSVYLRHSKLVKLLNLDVNVVLKNFNTLESLMNAVEQL